MEILVETSARHVHLSRKVCDVLFGENYELTPKRFLSQPGQFVCEEKVDIIGDRNSVSGVSILGPLREKSQVELSMTDARNIGIKTIIRESGSLSGSAGCKLIGPKGEYDLKEGVIIAKRHIHMTPKDAECFGVKDGQIVLIKVKDEERSTIFGDVVVRVSDKYSLACHIDTDESNAAHAGMCTKGEIILNDLF